MRGAWLHRRSLVQNLPGRRLHQDCTPAVKRLRLLYLGQRGRYRGSRLSPGRRRFAVCRAHGGWAQAQKQRQPCRKPPAREMQTLCFIRHSHSVYTTFRCIVCRGRICHDGESGAAPKCQTVKLSNCQNVKMSPPESILARRSASKHRCRRRQASEQLFPCRCVP